MRVRLAGSALDGERVPFTCAFGPAEGAWHGPPARAGEERHVELDLLGPLSWGSTAAPVAASAPALEPAGGRVAVVGQLESVSEDGVAVLRLGPSVVLVEVAGPAPAPGGWVRLLSEGLALYDTGI